MISIQPTLCQNAQIDACKNYCGSLCKRDYSTRPYASNTGSVRTSRMRCDAQCDKLCDLNKKHLKDAAESLDAPLAYAVSHFYRDQARCFPIEKSLFQKARNALLDWIVYFNKHTKEVWRKFKGQPIEDDPVKFGPEMIQPQLKKAP